MEFLHAATMGLCFPVELRNSATRICEFLVKNIIPLSMNPSVWSNLVPSLDSWAWCRV